MVQVCESVRDRAILMLLYDGGFRIGELGKLTWGQIAFDSYGVVINVDEKTGKPCYVRLIAAIRYLAKWKDDYPFEPAGNNLVFVSHQKKAIECSIGQMTGLPTSTNYKLQAGFWMTDDACGFSVVVPLPSTSTRRLIRTETESTTTAMPTAGWTSPMSSCTSIT